MLPTAPQPRAIYLLLALIALAAAGKPILYDTLDPDCFWHLKVAEQIAREGPRPLVDPLSFASSKTPWTPYSWLAELGMKSLWDLGGFRAALLAHSLLNGAFVLLIAAACIRRAGDPPARQDPVDLQAKHHRALRPHPTAMLPAALFATFLSLPYLSFRPATLAILILASIACLLERHRARPTRAVWLLIPLTALLANIHLFAFLVPLWMGCRWVGAMIEARTRRASPASACLSQGESSNARHHYAALFIATALAACATPLLPGVIQTILHYQFADPMVASGKLAEMRPFYTGTLGLVSAIVVSAFFALVLIRRKRLTATDLLLLALSTALLLSKGRYAPLFAITAAPMFVRLCASAIRMTAIREPSLRETASDFNRIIASSASPQLPIAPSPRRSPLANPLLSPALTLLLALGVFRLIAAFPSADLSAFLNRHGPEAPGYPTAAADYIAQHVPARSGRIVNDFTWGGYLEYRLGPSGFQTLMDGRTQCFSADFWKAFCLGPADATAHALSVLQADAALLPRKDSRLKPALIAQGWRWVYTDDRADVLLPPTSLREASLGNEP